MEENLSMFVRLMYSGNAFVVQLLYAANRCDDKEIGSRNGHSLPGSRALAYLTRTIQCTGKDDVCKKADRGG